MAFFCVHLSVFLKDCDVPIVSLHAAVYFFFLIRAKLLNGKKMN